MRFEIVLFTKLVTVEQCQQMAATITTQLGVFASDWGFSPSDVVAYNPNPKAITPGAIACRMIDEDPNAPGALAYHDEQGDVPYIDVLCKTIRQYGGSVCQALSHEILEARADLDCNEWDDGPEIDQGSSYAREVCDPVENGMYEMNGQQVSNYVLPSWFDPESTKGPWDKMSQAPGPFQLASGGYMVVRNEPGSEQQVLGKQALRWKQVMRYANKKSRLRRRVGK